MLHTSKPTILTGDRPTGPLHLGHFVGSLQNRVALQHSHKQFVLIADSQALTDNSGRLQLVHDSVLEVALDYLAVGIDFKQSTVLIQSQVPELSELSQYLLNLVTVARLERNPTIRQEVQQRGFERDIPMGFLAYPVSQAADILAFKATVIPAGEDQLPLIEQANEIARKFNAIAGYQVFSRCDVLLSTSSRLPGINGSAKMSKSLGNAIYLKDSPDAVRKKVNDMYTDPGHVRVSDPGNVEGNVVFAFLDAFDPNSAQVEELKQHYMRGGLGDRVLKMRLTEILIELLRPIQARRASYAQDPAEVFALLKAGVTQARATAAATLSEVRKALGLVYF